MSRITYSSSAKAKTIAAWCCAAVTVNSYPSEGLQFVGAFGASLIMLNVLHKINQLSADELPVSRESLIVNRIEGSSIDRNAMANYYSNQSNRWLGCAVWGLPIARFAPYWLGDQILPYAVSAIGYATTECCINAYRAHQFCSRKWSVRQPQDANNAPKPD
ncbi:MAG: hypothetical protein ABTQ34_06190 [Bdellovibrionales bacterium]